MSNKKIVVINSGWIGIGEVSEANGKTRIEDASVVRRWGTTNGIGELALNGPTKDTILDYAGVIEVYNHAVIMTIDCVY